MSLFTLISFLFLLLAVGLQAAPTHHQYHHTSRSVHTHEVDSLPPARPVMASSSNKQSIAADEPRAKSIPRDLKMVSVVALTAEAGTRGFVDDTLVMRSTPPNDITN
jgi:hypothetical protein